MHLEVFEAFRIVFLAKFLLSIDRELDVDYFGIKIRKIEPVINPVEGLIFKFPLILAHPVHGHLFAIYPMMLDPLLSMRLQPKNFESFRK